MRAEMEIHEHLQERLSDSEEVQRTVLFDQDSGARHLSAVLVRLPANYEFSLHTHPTSEDCFFVLSGAGEALEPARSLPISFPAGVWIPAGHPHGLRAGFGGMLEIGFQSPPDHTVVPFEARESDPRPRLVASTPPTAASSSPWFRAFPGPPVHRYLEAEYRVLSPGQSIAIGSPDLEWAIVVASGEVELSGAPSRRLSAFGVLRLDPSGSLTLRATNSPTLLIGVKARVTGLYEGATDPW